MSGTVRVRPHRRETKSNGVKREAHKAASDFKTGSKNLGRDFKSGWKREFGRRPKHEYYVRGVSYGKVESSVITASSKKEAREEFRELHGPRFTIVQVNKRD